MPPTGDVPPKTLSTTENLLPENPTSAEVLHPKAPPRDTPQYQVSYTSEIRKGTPKIVRQIS